MIRRLVGVVGGVRIRTLWYLPLTWSLHLHVRVLPMYIPVQAFLIFIAGPDRGPAEGVPGGQYWCVRGRRFFTPAADQPENSNFHWRRHFRSFGLANYPGAGRSRRGSEMGEISNSDASSVTYALGDTSRKHTAHKHNAQVVTQGVASISLHQLRIAIPWHCGLAFLISLTMADRRPVRSRAVPTRLRHDLGGEVDAVRHQQRRSGQTATRCRSASASRTAAYRAVRDEEQHRLDRVALSSRMARPVCVPRACAALERHSMHRGKPICGRERASASKHRHRHR
jgi:hypothetical protein